jgi:hypothetical protein
MSLADSHFAAAHDHAAAWFGDAVSGMLPHGTDYESVEGATLKPERVERRTDGSGIKLVTLRDMTVKSTLVPGGTPRIDLRWKIGDDRYETDSIQASVGGYTQFTLRRVESKEVTGRGYRGER